MTKKTILDEKFWVENEGSLSKIGLTKSALHTFDHIEWIALPQAGAKLQKGETALVLESAKAAIDIESPLSGTVHSVNEELQASPHLLEENPDETWLFVISKGSKT